MSALKVSPIDQVRDLYETSADSYSKMMDSEIDLPVYSDSLSRLAARLTDLPGLVIDTSCGSGHMLSRYGKIYDPKRPLVGIDLSPSMVAIARARLRSNSEVLVGDMRELRGIDSGTAAALLSFFAIHHLAPREIQPTFQEWHRVLRPGGQLILAAWEGSGPIDYGDEAEVVALRYTQDEITAWITETAFVLNRCAVEPVEEISMNAIYLEATKVV